MHRKITLPKPSNTLKYTSPFTKALIFDVESAYDLAELTNNAKSFEKVFQPLVSSDSLEGIKEAENLLAHCMNYGRLTGFFTGWRIF